MGNPWLEKKIEISGNVPPAFKQALKDNNVSEEEIDLLSSKTWVPGKAEKEEVEVRSMGLPKDLMTVTFSRKFRFTFEPEEEPGNGEVERPVTHFVKDMDLDRVANKLRLSIYDVASDGADRWLESLRNNKKTADIKLWDGCGQLLYYLKLTGLSLEEWKNGFDYSSSDVLMHEVVLKFEHCRKHKQKGYRRE